VVTLDVVRRFAARSSTSSRRPVGLNFNGGIDGAREVRVGLDGAEDFRAKDAEKEQKSGEDKYGVWRPIFQRTHAVRASLSPQSRRLAF
jgi:hypothetical protein